MSKLTALQKEALLRGINLIPVSLIKKKIDNLELTIDECIENGLDASKVEEIQKVPPGEYDPPFESDDIYVKINNDEIIIQEIQEALIDGRVTEEGLLNNTEIDEKLLKRIIRYTKQFHPSDNNDVPLIDGTDIFFFGKSGSGKSCVLASIFNYAESKGLFIDNPVSMKGINYKNLLVSEFRNGILPNNAPKSVDAVTYITTGIHKDGQINPLNIVEMSSEFLFFSRAAEAPSYWENTIDAPGYLSNANKKLLFFIVDYNFYNEGESSIGPTQDAEINLILSQLEMYKKALKNTYCICIIVNKSDKFPEDVVDKNVFAKDFFIENFKGVYTNLKTKQEKYGFKVKILHFSIGDVIFNNSYLRTINTDCPLKLIKLILNYSSDNRGPSGLFRFSKSRF